MFEFRINEFDEDRIEVGSDVIYEALEPTISHQTKRFDVPSYIANYQIARRTLLEDEAYADLRFTEAEIEACLGVATANVEYYVDTMQELAIREQFDA